MANSMLKVIYNSGIYAIKNKANGKRYIGSAVDIRRRFTQHRSSLRHGIHVNSHLQGAWDIYGEKSFSFNPILFCDKSNLIYFEQRAIDAVDAFNPCAGYNLASKAGSNLGMKHTAECKARMSKSTRGINHPNYGKKLSEATRQKISEALMGVKTRPLTEFEKMKRSKAQRGEKNHNYGKHLSDSTKQKMSKARKGEYLLDKACNARAIIDTWDGKRFDTIKEAAKQISLHRSTIDGCLKNKRPNSINAGRFRYAEELGR